MQLSISDIRLFNRCRRKWDLTSPNRQNLVRMLNTQTYFFVGTVIHRALDMMAREQYHDDKLDSIIDDEIAQQEETYRSVVGTGFSPSEIESFYYSEKPLIRGMLRGYQQRYGPKPLEPLFTYLASEVSFMVTIPGSFANSGALRGTVDGLAINNQTGGVWVVEHKTFSQTPDLNGMMFDEQLRAYAWAIPRCTDIDKIEGVLYDGLLKKLPTVPQVLKNGTMSKRQLVTTPRVYRQAVIDAGLEPADYEDHISTIDTEDRFFIREPVVLYQSSLKDLQEQLVNIDTVMDDVNQNGRIYPNRVFSGCTDCGVREICDAMTIGDEFTPFDFGFVKGSPYGTFAAKNPITERAPLSILKEAKMNVT